MLSVVDFLDRPHRCTMEDYVRTNAIIYGRDPNKKITNYQEQVNCAAVELALLNPDLLQRRKELLESARQGEWRIQI